MRDFHLHVSRPFSLGLLQREAPQALHLASPPKPPLGSIFSTFASLICNFISLIKKKSYSWQWAQFTVNSFCLNALLNKNRLNYALKEKGMHMCSVESLLCWWWVQVQALSCFPNTDRIGKHVPETKFRRGFGKLCCIKVWLEKKKKGKRHYKITALSFSWKDRLKCVN